MCESKSFKLIEFTWKITNFSQQKLENGKSVHPFSVGCEDDLKFILHFYPQGRVQSGDTEVSNGGEWTSLYLQAKGSQKYLNSHHVEFSILDENGEKFGIRHFYQKIPFIYGYPKFIRLTDLENPANNLLPDDTLTICCRVTETESKTKGDCNCQIEQPQTARSRRKMCEDLTSISAHKYADFVFKVDNVKIPAHRNILAAKSPVFDAMFHRNMKKNRTNKAKIKDVTPAAFKALLRFIYTGHCEVGNLAEELLVVADKYDIRELKEICAKELRKKLTVDNAVDLLILSDLHQANVLKDGVMRFINENAAAVTKTPSWSNFHKSHPNLLRELFNKLLV